MEDSNSSTWQKVGIYSLIGIIAIFAILTFLLSIRRTKVLTKTGLVKISPTLAPEQVKQIVQPSISNLQNSLDDISNRIKSLTPSPTK